MPAREPPAACFDETDAVLDKCVLRDAGSIRALLQRLVDRRCVLTATLAGDAAGAVTAVLAVDGTTLWIDVPRDPAKQRRMLRAPRLAFRGVLDKAALRFSCGPAVAGIHDGAPALGLPLPDQVLHLQRRELMRREPMPGSLTCLVYARPPDELQTPVPGTIRDIGGGGLAILTAGDELDLAIGTRLPHCVITLPGTLGAVDVALRVRHLRQVVHHGHDVRQAGCEFVDLSPAAQAKLFRYLMQLDRDALRAAAT